MDPAPTRAERAFVMPGPRNEHRNGIREDQNDLIFRREFSRLATRTGGLVDLDVSVTP